MGGRVVVVGIAGVVWVGGDGRHVWWEWWAWWVVGGRTKHNLGCDLVDLSVQVHLAKIKETYIVFNFAFGQ